MIRWLEHTFAPDDAWERDVALSTRYRLPMSIIAITIGYVFLVLSFEAMQELTVREALEKIERLRVE